SKAGDEGKSLVTALTNRHKEIVLKKLEKLRAEYPDVDIQIYSDYKSLRFAVKEPLPPGFRERIDKFFREAGEEFAAEVKNLKLVRADDKPADWFRAGEGASADQANLAARYSRTAEGQNRIRSFSETELRQNLEATLKQAELRRAELQKRFAGTDLLQQVPGTDKQVLSREIIELGRREKDPRELQRQIELRYNVQVSENDVRKIQEYLSSVDQFSPGIFVAHREVASLAQSGAGGLTADFTGMGAYNLSETAAAIAKSNSLDEALVLSRLGEQKVTELFQKRMAEREKIITDYLKDKRKMDDLRITCSGDDCVAFGGRSITPKEREELVQRLSRTDAPSSIRMAFVGPNVRDQAARTALAGHGENLEKMLRQRLAGKIPQEKMNKILFGIEMQGNRAGQGGVRLITGNSRVKLTVEERAAIEAAFRDSVQHLNREIPGGGRYQVAGPR
ncbi:MAG: hypothetical protein N2578_09425, partial [Bdellovibrionaceae bacterium]|nr:hypothetical protein [Pseudobdellovibrionaceae bacterium]